jgi:hypothetical protein
VTASHAGRSTWSMLQQRAHVACRGACEHSTPQHTAGLCPKAKDQLSLPILGTIQVMTSLSLKVYLVQGLGVNAAVNTHVACTNNEQTTALLTSIS